MRTANSLGWRCQVAAPATYDGVLKNSKSLYHGHRFPAEIIRCAVRWYFRFQLSLRDIENRLFERGVIVTYASKEVALGDETIRCWCDKFDKGFAHRVKAAGRATLSPREVNAPQKPRRCRTAIALLQ